jgi:RimJ/RimL family protein N-acetyltransferase
MQGVGKFVAKIAEENVPSIALFTSLGFVEVSRSSMWKEVTMALAVDAPTAKKLADAAAHATQEAYDLSN